MRYRIGETAAELILRERQDLQGPHAAKAFREASLQIVCLT